MHKCVTFELKPTSKLEGKIRVPGDKSISHRAIMLGAIADGVSEVSGFLFGADNLATIKAFQQLGVTIESNERQIEIHGVGKMGLKEAPGALDMGNSGTGMRLLTGLLCGQGFNSTLIGDESLSARPMERIVKPLCEMGAEIELSPTRTAPIRIHGHSNLTGIEYTLPVASAQVKSAILLAGLYAKGETIVYEPEITRDHTERMLQAFQYPFTKQNNTIKLTGGHALQACRIEIPADVSSAAFFMVAASIVPNAQVILQSVGINPTRIGILNILRQMGADITLHNQREFGSEPVADIEVRNAPLKGITIPQDQVPLAIDEMPVIMVAAACAKGETHLRGAAELRVKETDRIAAMAKGLKHLGIQCKVFPDGITIQGGRFTGGTVDSLGDHRIAMAFAVAACVAEAEVTVTDCHNVQTSFPNFKQLAQKIGFNLT